MALRGRGDDGPRATVYPQLVTPGPPEAGDGGDAVRSEAHDNVGEDNDGAAYPAPLRISRSRAASPKSPRISPTRRRPSAKTTARMKVCARPRRPRMGRRRRSRIGHISRRNLRRHRRTNREHGPRQAWARLRITSTLPGGEARVDAGESPAWLQDSCGGTGCGRRCRCCCWCRSDDSGRGRAESGAGSWISCPVASGADVESACAAQGVPGCGAVGDIYIAITRCGPEPAGAVIGSAQRPTSASPGPPSAGAATTWAAPLQSPPHPSWPAAGPVQQPIYAPQPFPHDAHSALASPVPGMTPISPLQQGYPPPPLHSPSPVNSTYSIPQPTYTPSPMPSPHPTHVPSTGTPQPQRPPVHQAMSDPNMPPQQTPQSPPPPYPYGSPGPGPPPQPTYAPQQQPYSSPPPGAPPANGAGPVYSSQYAYGPLPPYNPADPKHPPPLPPRPMPGPYAPMAPMPTGFGSGPAGAGAYPRPRRPCTRPGRIPAAAAPARWIRRRQRQPVQQRVGQEVARQDEPGAGEQARGRAAGAAGPAASARVYGSAAAAAVPAVSPAAATAASAGREGPPGPQYGYGPGPGGPPGPNGYAAGPWGPPPPGQGGRHGTREGFESVMMQSTRDCYVLVVWACVMSHVGYAGQAPTGVIRKDSII
ncbi:hypothetical protein ACCO45_010350 [Purpureocillium lilacinum]|uniref:Uncharacterized protein n=1 Tax=Purpureocillium lilacinum TaxID=33203 RepID=A0ACC4DEL0_PURLI